ncbi:MaoC/PaaZ C-terminal domain-containing protein [Aeromicrobium sp. UC242_57]|uniref:MaoC/PaaZ C-terminal domain-containing protein n=1 Tax=Aeromicrobium sp. UC242_57 TaxID=3374624 RepID=UPI0037B7ECD7
MFFDDFYAGQAFTSQGRTITDSDVAQFAAWSWDTNPVHTDAEHMRQSRFGAPIAHGLLGVSVAMGLISRLGIFEDCSIALLGIDGWTFLLPVRPGDTVHCRVEILSTRLTSSSRSGVLERRIELINHADEVVQCGNISLLVAVRP